MQIFNAQCPALDKALLNACMSREFQRPCLTFSALKQFNVFVRAYSLFAEACAAIILLHALIFSITVLSIYLDSRKKKKERKTALRIAFQTSTLFLAIVMPWNKNWYELAPILEAQSWMVDVRTKNDVRTWRWLNGNFSVICSLIVGSCLFPEASPEKQLRKKLLGKNITLAKWTFLLYNKEHDHYSFSLSEIIIIRPNKIHYSNSLEQLLKCETNKLYTPSPSPPPPQYVWRSLYCNWSVEGVVDVIVKFVHGEMLKKSLQA